MPKKSQRTKTPASPAGRQKPRTKKNRLVVKFLVAAGIAVVLLFAVFAFVFNVNILAKPCANSISCIDDLSGKYEPGKEAIYLGNRINTPQNLAADITKSNVLGETMGGEKRIYVDLTNQRLYAFDGEKLTYNFPVSTGKWNHTPTGDFKIWIKLRYTRMSGGSGADYYDLPNVPYTMFYYNNKVSKAQGYSIHGAYWHNNFGFPMSHGCINMRPEDAGLVFAWAHPTDEGNTTYATESNPGTSVTVYGETPTY